MNRTLSRLTLGAIMAAALFAVACGGGGGGIGGGGSSSITGGDFNKDPVNFARAYYFTAFRVFTGDTTAEDMMKLFEDSCRSKVAPADVSKGLEKSRDEFPKLKGAKIEDIDFQGKAKVKKTDKGATVTIPSAKDSRVKVDGKYLNAFDYFKSVGVVGDKDSDDPEDVELVLVNGRYFDADCSNLTDISDSGKRANATPTPERATPTPARGTATVSPTTSTANRTPTPSATTRSGTSNFSNADIESYSKKYLLMILGTFSGQTKADDALAFFTNDCRAKVKTADLTAGLTRLQTQFPKMKGAKYDDLDFGGKIKITPGSGDKYTVQLPGSKDVRIKVDGSFVNLHTYLQSVGLESSSDTGIDTSDQDFIVQGGKLFDVDCEFIQDISR